MDFKVDSPGFEAFETVMGLIIMGNLVLIFWEADQDAKCYPDYNGLQNKPTYDQCPWRSSRFGLLGADPLRFNAIYMPLRDVSIINTYVI